ncbi:MAG: caspase family protein, partial [Chloroflexi bacterium]|nr:caspase family protein [Chloroflexota bacterium]
KTQSYQVARQRFPDDSSKAVQSLAQWEGKVAQRMDELDAGDRELARAAKDRAARLDDLLLLLRADDRRVAVARDSARRADSVRADEAEQRRVAAGLAERRRADSVTNAVRLAEARRADSVRAAEAARVAAERRADSLRAADAARAVAAEKERERQLRLAAGELLPPRTVFNNPKAVAVVIGNRTYRDAGVPSVDYAGNDARKVREFLETALGFRPENVIFREDATQATFNQIFGKEGNWQGELYNFLDPSPGTSDVFVFYSGHGAPDPGGSRSTFLVPSDANPDQLPLTGYSVKTLYGNLAQLPARSVTVVLDACFTGVSANGPLFKGISPVGIDYDTPEITSRNLTVLTASAKNQVSHWYDKQEHGLFTYVFLRQLQRTLDATDGRVIPSAQQLGDSLAVEVDILARRLRNKRQNPQVSGPARNQPLPFLRR